MSMASHFRVASALLLSTGLFNLARGSVSSRDHEVSSDGPLEVVHGNFEQPGTQTRNRNEIPLVSTEPTARLPVDGETNADVEGDNQHLLSRKLSASVGNSRRLQEWACDGNSSMISVSSTIYPLLEGCLTLVESNSSFVYYSSTARVGFVKSTSTGNDAVPKEQNWNALYEYSADVWLRACTSAEYASEVDASEATWNCTGDTNADVYVDTMVEEYLSISCGCPTTSPSPSPTSPAPSSTGACGDSNSFSIASETLPGAEGCFVETTQVVNGEVVYTTSGTLDEEQTRMIAIDVTGEDTSTPIAWALVNAVSTSAEDINGVYCLSEEDATLFHPSEVPYWNCGAEGTSSETAGNIAVECGCLTTSPTVAPSPVPSPTAAPTASSISPVASSSGQWPTASPMTSPTASPTASPIVMPLSTSAPSQGGAISSANTCTGDGSFALTSNAAPGLDGCFVDVASSATDEAVVYTVSGTSDTAEIAVTLLENDSGNVNWHIVCTPFGADSSEESRTYCISAEPASEVDPGNASWNCDFFGDGGNFLATTEEQISIECGACTVTEDASKANNLVVDVVTASGAAMVTVASTLGGWCYL